MNTIENENLRALLQAHHDNNTRHSRARRAADSTCAEAPRDPLGGLIESGYLQSQLGKDTAAILAEKPISGAEIDAERYRYMRNNAAFLNRGFPCLFWHLPRWLAGSAAEQLDQAIDEQLRRPKP